MPTVSGQGNPYPGNSSNPVAASAIRSASPLPRSKSTELSATPRRRPSPRYSARTTSPPTVLGPNRLKNIPMK